MKTYSKRYNYNARTHLAGRLSNEKLRRAHLRRRVEFVDSNLRTRLNQELAYVVGCGEFLEPFLLKKYKGEDGYVFSTNALRNIGNLELGYDITKYYSPEELTPISMVVEGDSMYHDPYFIDLLEIAIIFSKTDKREATMGRLQRILDEENAGLTIQGYMFIRKDSEGLRSVVEILNDETLKNKLSDLHGGISDSSTAAGLSADVTQFVFSSHEKGKTKKDTEKMVQKIAERWVEPKNQDAFANLLNTLVKNIKAINNEITNIRHTDRSTIDYKSPDIFRMIKGLNLAISELAILSVHDEFIENIDSNDHKENYMKGYGIVNKHELSSRPNDTVDLIDIPF